MKVSKEEFLQIISDYQDIIKKVNLIYFKNKADRDDNFQEIMYKLWKSFPTLKNKEAIASWIYKIAINTAISKIKKDSRFSYNEDITKEKDNCNIYDDFTKDEELRLLLKAIYMLNEIDKSIMLLYLEEKSYGEISDIIGISPNNVGIRINRAKKQLKYNLKKLNYEK